MSTSFLDALDAVHGHRYGNAAGEARTAIPAEALQPWPRRPPLDLSEVQPGRWRVLARLRDP